MTFYVLPHKDLGYKSFKRERLVANDFLQIRKVIEHVYEKVIGNGSDAGSSAAGSPTGTAEREQQQASRARAVLHLAVSLFSCGQSALWRASRQNVGVCPKGRKQTSSYKLLTQHYIMFTLKICSIKGKC